MPHNRNQPPRPVDTPTPGWYASRSVRRGPRVAFRIAEQDGIWTLYRNGAVLGRPGLDPWKVHPSMEWIAFGERVTEQQYLDLLAAAAEAPAGHPLADLEAPVDLANAPPLYRRKNPL